MSKFGVAIPYFVGMILGIICLGVAVYLIYTNITNSPINCSQCSAELTSWCVNCYKVCGNANWNGDNIMDSKLSECVTRCNLLSAPHNSCDPISFEFCKAYIPL